jgi:hypothetical protein
MELVSSKMDVEYQTHHIQCLESFCQMLDHNPAPDTTILLSNLQQEIIQVHQDVESTLLLKQLFICNNVLDLMGGDATGILVITLSFSTKYLFLHSG